MTTEHITAIPLTRLHESPTNPRKTYSAAAMAELADSIRSQGLLQPIVVRPSITATFDTDELFEIVFGHRRFRAATMADMAEMPCIVRAMSDAEVAQAQLHENLEREDVSPLEEADAYARLMRDHGVTADQLVADTGKSRTYIYNRLKLTALTEASRQAVQLHGIGPEIATLIARVPAPMQGKAIDRVLVTDYDTQTRQVTSYRAARQALQRDFTITIVRADGERLTDFDPADEALSTCGACTACPKLSSNDPGLVEALGTGVCTDVPCHDEKAKAYDYAKWAIARAAGRVIEGEAADAVASTMPGRPPKGYVFLNSQCYPNPGAAHAAGGMLVTYRQALAKLADAGRLVPDDYIKVIDHHGKFVECITDTDAAIVGHSLRTLLAPAQPEGEGGSEVKGSGNGNELSGVNFSFGPETRTEDESPEAVAVTRRWPQILRAIMRKAVASERTIDDLRLVVITLADMAGELPQELVDVMGWTKALDAADLGYGEDVDWLINKQLPDMSADQLGALVTLFALAHAPVITFERNTVQGKRELADHYGVDVLNPEGQQGSQQTDNAGAAGDNQSDEAGSAGQAPDQDRCPNTADMFGATAKYQPDHVG